MAIDRYNYPDNIKLNEKGQRVYTSMYYPKIAVSNSDIYIISKESDRLDLLAVKYYDDTTKWWIIAHANQLKGTFFIEPGIQLRIPMDVAQIMSDLKYINKA
jgi:nucleoid-associated protein YgaU